ncbi:MAG: hypothetical protein K9L25_07260 [Methylovulum sp.]|jgi:hypothetical protein|nr:hypothetical protein [Methylovulum sp.]
MTEQTKENLDDLHRENVKDEVNRVAKENEKIGTVLGMGVGSITSVATLSSLGTVQGLSAAGISSGLAAAGGLVGGGIVAGASVIAAPVAVLGLIGYSIFKFQGNKAQARLDAKLLKEERDGIKKEVTDLEDSLYFDFEHD